VERGTNRRHLLRCLDMQGADRTFEVKGLTPHQEYGFRLRAVNMAGQSEWGPVAIYRTSAAPPGKPEAVEAYSQVRHAHCVHP
jgi:hypothetical protein